MKKIRLAIAGYGNLGRAVLQNLPAFSDMEAVALISRRPIKADLPVYTYEQASELKGKVDVVIMCGGSAFDLPTQSPLLAKDFCIVDSFDTHANIIEHMSNVEKAATKGGTLAAVSIGWDPGLFSIARALFSSVLPQGKDYTFWGKGVSQGHSDALRNIEGVEGAVQYTIPKDEAISKAKSSERPTLSTKEKHLRECFVAVKDGADKAKIEQQIRNMPAYFEGYDVRVNFVSMKELEKNHSTLPHGGFVLYSGQTQQDVNHLLELKLSLDSNPHFTSSVMLCYARAVHKMHSEGKTGALSVLDVPLSYLSMLDRETLIKTLV